MILLISIDKIVWLVTQLIIQGSGAVRAGMWARAVCINDSLEMGSILPYLVRAKKNGLGVIVFNPNLNHVDTVPHKYTATEFMSPEVPRRTGASQRIKGRSLDSFIVDVQYCFLSFIAFVFQ